MAKHSISHKHSKIKCYRSRSNRKDKTQYGGFVSIAKSWTELSIPALVTTFSIVKKGLDAASLLLLYIFRILSLKRSTYDFLKSSDDPLVEELTGLKNVNSSVISKFLNNERFLLKPLQEAVVSRIASILVKSHSEGILVFDNTIIAKTGKNHRMARKLKDPATDQYIIGYDIVSAHFRYNGISFPLLFEFAFGQPNKPIQKTLVYRNILQGQQTESCAGEIPWNIFKGHSQPYCPGFRCLPAYSLYEGMLSFSIRDYNR